MAIPVKAFSEIGVSITHLEPNFYNNPFDTLYAPSYYATSSPIRNTHLSQIISSSIPSFIASLIVIFVYILEIDFISLFIIIMD